MQAEDLNLSFVDPSIMKKRPTAAIAVLGKASKRLKGPTVESYIDTVSFTQVSGSSVQQHEVGLPPKRMGPLVLRNDCSDPALPTTEAGGVSPPNKPEEEVHSRLNATQQG